MKKTYRIKTNNQEQLQRKQNESDATSKWIEFQKTRPRRRIQDNNFLILYECELVWNFSWVHTGFLAYETVKGWNKFTSVWQTIEPLSNKRRNGQRSIDFLFTDRSIVSVSTLQELFFCCRLYFLMVLKSSWRTDRRLTSSRILLSSTANL